MNIEIKPLTPELVPDYLDFFDHRAFSDGSPNGPCYCTSPSMTTSDEAQMISEFSDDFKGTLRRYAVKLLAEEKIRGYLAFDTMLLLDGATQEIEMPMSVGYLSLPSKIRLARRFPLFVLLLLRNIVEWASRMRCSNALWMMPKQKDIQPLKVTPGNWKSANLLITTDQYTCSKKQALRKLLNQGNS